jgi:hypothetical protein
LQRFPGDAKLCEPTLAANGRSPLRPDVSGGLSIVSARTRLTWQALDDLSSRLAIGYLDLGLEPVVKRARRQRHRRSTRKKPPGWRAGHRFGVDLASGGDAVGEW